MQFIRRAGDALFVNPGSVGASWDHGPPFGEVRPDPWAAYAVVEVEAGRLEVGFRRVAYDTSAVVAAFLSSGHPDRDE